MLNESLKIISKNMTSNTIWIFSNLIGEENPQIKQLILEQTDLVSFLSSLDTQTDNFPSLLVQLPWLCQNLVKSKPEPNVEQMEMIFSVLYICSKQHDKIKRKE